MSAKQEEFLELITPHMQSLENTARRLTHDSTDAEDLLQETMFKAYKALHQFQRDTNFRAWIFRILVNTYITSYRKAKRKPQKVSYDEMEDFSFYKKIDREILDEEIPDQKYVDQMFNDEIKTALEKLPYQFRLIVLLCDIEGFSYKEIANVVNIPIGTVMSRLFRGRKLLQRFLWRYAKNLGLVSQDAQLQY